jgi:transposase-like protein
MDKLLTSKDIAQLAGVRPNTVRQWRTRFGDFPLPAAVYGDTPVYEREPMLAWLRKHGRVAE